MFLKKEDQELINESLKAFQLKQETTRVTASLQLSERITDRLMKEIQKNLQFAGGMPMGGPRGPR
jgi:hypothetical protein